MKHLRSTAFGPLMALLLAAACGGQTELDPAADDGNAELGTQHRDLTLPPSETAELARAYDTQRQSLFFRSCVSGETAQGQNADGVLEVKHNMSFDDVLTKVAGSLDVGVSIAVVKAGAGASIANQHATTSLSETSHLVWIANTKSDVLRPDSIRVNSNGQDMIDTRQGELQSLCGDEFIAEVKRGASFLATLKLEFLNDEDRRELQGKLKIDVKGGLATFDGSLDNVDAAKLRRTSLSVLVRQNGGRPERMLSILPNGLMTCSLENRAPCLEVYENLIKYGKDDFATQVAEREQQNVIGYVTRRYADSQAEALVPRQGYALVNAAVSNKLRQIEGLLRRAMADQLRADNLLGMGGVDFSSEQRRQLREISGMAGENVITYAEISRFCYADMDEDCLRYARDRQGDPLAPTEEGRRGDVYVYDPRTLELEIEEPAPSGPCPPSAEGSPCDDGLFCSDQSVCRAGACVATTPHACGALSVCDESQKACSCTGCRQPDGSCAPPQTWYRDADGDGFGDPTSTVTACTQPAGFTGNSQPDCCDRDRNAWPGQAAFFKTVNACNSWDYDCSGSPSYQLITCPSASASCGCMSSRSCNAGSCGTSQPISQCRTSGSVPYQTTVCSSGTELLGCR